MRPDPWVWTLRLEPRDSTLICLLILLFYFDFDVANLEDPFEAGQIFTLLLSVETMDPRGGILVPYVLEFACLASVTPPLSVLFS